VIVYSHPDCLQHSPGPGHPEAAARLSAVLDAIAEMGLTVQQAPAARREQLAAAHSDSMIDLLVRSAPSEGLVRIDADTVMSPASISAAIHAAGAGVAGVDDLLGKRSTRVFCAVRPPGHHSTRGEAMGFCLFNSIAVAAAHALQRGVERLTIIDFDVHHGNGTQDIFWNEPRVQYVSSHQSPLYPGTGADTETGRAGNVVNAGLPEGTDSHAFRHVWRSRLLPAIDRFGPQMLLISAGFDAHYLDPLAGLALREADFAWVTHELVVLANKHAQGRILSMLEGGYSLSALRESVKAHLQALC
jgi:acetoin utilization deacetylase AcuC-like enzyme